MSEINWQPIESGMMSHVAYDADLLTLYVRYSGGSEYAYAPVPQEKFDGLLAAERVSKYFNTEIRGVYLSRKIEQIQEEGKQ